MSLYSRTDGSQVTNRAAQAQDFAEGSGEVDPLDAFMAQNDATIAEGEEIDPLDAFMANEIAPAVRARATEAAGEPSSAPDAKAEVKVEDIADVKPTGPTLQARSLRAFLCGQAAGGR